MQTGSVHEPLAFWVPESFRPRAVLPPKLSVYELRSHYIMSTIIHRLGRQYDREAGVTINQKIIEQCKELFLDVISLINYILET